MVVRTNELSYTMSMAEAELGRGQNRMASFHLGDRIVFVVADAAGSAAGGAFAAETLCDAVAESCSRVKAKGWTTWLRSFDCSTPLTGLVAALIIEVTSSGHAFGTSVGDCEAWLFTDPATELTEGQFRRPFLGLGMARPISFAADVGGGVLVLATDGLWKRARREWIRRIATREPLDYAAATLIDAAMADDGRPRDDTSLCIIEVAAERPRPRRRRLGG
jgi:serine/threonine protein phosphatase PrpC